MILLKYWLEVSPEEQTRRLEARMEDGRKLWKLSPMDLKSYSRWYRLLARARRNVHRHRHRLCPWFVAPSNDKRRVRLNIISHLLEHIPYKALPREKIKLPKRQKRGGYRDTNYPYKFIKERY